MLTREEDVVSSVFITSNHQTLLCFSNQGRVFDIKVYELPDLPLRSRGKHFASMVKLTENEKIVSVLPVKEFKEGHYVVSVTAQWLRQEDRPHGVFATSGRPGSSR